jgi:hypothetical protein
MSNFAAFTLLFIELSEYKCNAEKKEKRIKTRLTLMKSHLNKEHLASVKKSFFNILALFLGEDKMQSRYLRCLLKWGFQLHLSPDDLKHADVDLTHLAFLHPGEKVQKLEAIYHLVYMIYLDEVVEDVELEVATIYAEKLGFAATTVSELFKSIATADADEKPQRNVHAEVLDFLRLHEA